MNHDEANAVAVDAAGNIVVAGSMGSGAGAVVIKYAPEGTERWRRVLDSTVVALGVATDVAGNIVVVGATRDSLYDNATFVASFSADGTLRWVEQPETAGDDWAHGVAIDAAAGNIFVVGLQPGSTPYARQGYLAAFSEDGTEQWRHRFGGGDSDDDGVYGVAIDSASNVVIGGTAFNVGFAASYTPAGALLWTRPLASHIYEVATDATGHIAIAGRINRRSDRGDDGFLARYALP